MPQSGQEEEEYRSVGTKIVLELNVDKKVVEDFNEILLKEQEIAEKNDKPTPNKSQIGEMLLRKGIRIYRDERR